MAESSSWLSATTYPAGWSGEPHPIRELDSAAPLLLVVRGESSRSSTILHAWRSDSGTNAAYIKLIKTLILTMGSISVISNTTCPVSDLVATDWHLEKSNLVLEQYGSNVGIFQLCPPALFTNIIELSDLRLQATKQQQQLLSFTGAESNLSDQGYDILNRIHNVSLDHWAQSKPSLQEDWILVGTIYQCSVALYCILSLQSLSVFPITPELRALCEAHGRTLRSHLIRGLASPKISRFLLWPLVVLGVEAVHGDAETRGFVIAQLQLLSRDVGTSVPIIAKNVLESFWESGDTRWDACFDRAYAFTTQIAVDNSRIVC